MDRLDEMLDQELAPTWKPEVGDTLKATVLRYGLFHGRYGESPYCVVRKDSGDELTVWLTTVALRSRFQELKPAPGERVGIRRLPDGDHWQRFKLAVDRPEPGASVLDSEPQGVGRPAQPTIWAEDEQERDGFEDDGLPF